MTYMHVLQDRREKLWKKTGENVQCKTPLMQLKDGIREKGKRKNCHVFSQKKRRGSGVERQNKNDANA